MNAANTPPNLNDAERECYEVARKATPGPYDVCPMVHDSWGTVRGHEVKAPWGTYRVLVASTCFVSHIPNDWRDDESNWVNGECKSPPVIEANARNFTLNANPITVHARLRELSDLRGQVAALTAERERLRGLIREWAIIHKRALSELNSGETRQASWSRLRAAEVALREEAAAPAQQQRVRTMAKTKVVKVRWSRRVAIAEAKAAIERHYAILSQLVEGCPHRGKTIYHPRQVAEDDPWVECAICGQEVKGK